MLPVSTDVYSNCIWALIVVIIPFFRIGEYRMSPFPKGNSFINILTHIPSENITLLTNGHNKGHRLEWLFLFRLFEEWK